jgi:2-methylaconitate cis-trans-isomerase PrpF
MAFIGNADISPTKNLVQDTTPQLGGNLDLQAHNIEGVDATEIAILDGATVTTAELNILDGVTSTAAELNILDGVTSTAAELNILDGVTSTTAELNVVDMSASGSTSGQLLTSTGTGSVPTWQAAPQGVSNSKLFYFGSFT